MSDSDREYTSGGIPNWGLIPPHCRDGIRYYIEKGIQPGDFLFAVFSNDLMEAAGRADGINQLSLHRYAQFLYNYAPPDCYGSHGKVIKWMEQGGLDGK